MPQGRAGLVEWCCIWPFFATSVCRDRKKIVIVLLGLDSAGKSTLLAKLRREKFASVLPTCGFACKTWKIQDFSVYVFDLGGRKGIRCIWPHYFAEAYGAIFVIDSTDQERFAEAKDELQNAVSNPYLLGKPILVVANKQEFASAMRFEDIKLALHSLESAHNLAECKCDLQEGGILDADFQEGLHWLLETIGLHHEELQERVQKDAFFQKAQEGKERAERRERITFIRNSSSKPHLRTETGDQSEQTSLKSPPVKVRPFYIPNETIFKGDVVDLLSELKSGKELDYKFPSQTMLLPGQVM